MLFLRNLSLSLLSVVFLSSGLLASTAADIRALTGAPTKIVWVQDAGDIASVFAERPTLRLMGLDTEDDQGEREILPGIARYWKPTIIDDGTRVMFGDLEKKTVHIVNWDGTGLRTVLTNAGFEDVWTDPRTGIIWVYAKVKEPRGDKVIDVIRRYQLDDLAVSELIWDKTPVFNFMVNGDGRAASGGIGVTDGGNTPQGIFFLPNKSFNLRANGCWPSMSPDNSLRSWVFNGNHRSVHFGETLDRTGKGYNYPVIFYDTPGLSLRRGEEAYHPRWSNHVRFLTITAPFYKWSYRAAAKIPNDVAAEVEIYLGEFTEDMKGVKRWVKVTNNQRGDYYPNAWIKPPAGPPAWLDDEPALAEGTVVVEPDQSGQVFRWDFFGAANQLIDAQSGAIRQSNGRLHGAARFERYGVLDLHAGFFAPVDTAEPWLQAIKDSDAFAIELVVTPATSASAAAEPVILAFGKSIASSNVILSQVDGWLTLRLRGDPDRSRQLVRLPQGEASHVIVSYAPGRLAVYVNGQRVLQPASPDLPVSGWVEQPLTLGNIASGGHDWAGLVENIGLLGREIEMAEAWQRADFYAARVTDRTAAQPRVIVDAKLVGVCPPADPLGIAPYRRCLSVQQYEVVKVIEGELTDKTISVAQWSVLDAKVVPGYLGYQPGQTYRLALEAWSDHPEQESERLISGDFEEEGDLFYQVHEAAPQSAKAAAKPAVIVEPEPAPVTPAAAVWTASPEQPGVQQLVGPVTVAGESNPTVFSAGGDIRRDVAGQDILLEAPSLSEILVSGELRIGGNGTVRTTMVLEEGIGYARAPSLELAGGGGQGGVLLADMKLTQIELLRLGSGYTSAPEVVITAPDIYGGRQAAAIAEIDENSGALKGLQLTDSGSGYLRAPRVALRGGGGRDAIASVRLSLDAVHLLHPGSGYTTAPEVIVSGGDGSGAEVLALLQMTTLRYTDPAGDAFIRNNGSIDQVGAVLRFDSAASSHALGTRGFENNGTWVIRNGAVVQFSTVAGNDFKAANMSNAGTLRILAGGRLGLDGLGNTGVLELGGGLLGQVEYGRFDTAFNNLGEVQVIADTDARPSVFGSINPSRNGERTVFNGVEPRAASGGVKARFQIGDGQDAAVFNVMGGQASFVNQPGAMLLLNEGATLGLLTNDNGSRHGAHKRDAKLINKGDLFFAGTLRVQGNHAGFTGLENSGRLVMRGSVVSIERLPNSAGPGSHYFLERNASRLDNLAAGTLMGAGTFTYHNSTGSEKAAYLRLINLGSIIPGSGDQPGELIFINTNIELGAVPPSDEGARKKSNAPPAGAGLLLIPVVNSSNHGSITVSGAEGSGLFKLTEGASNTLNIVTVGRETPRGKLRIVTAHEVVGQFTNLQFNGHSTVPYTVSYLTNAIEVTFP